MKDIALVIASLKSRKLNSLLSVLLTALGIGLAVILMQFGHYVQNRIHADGKGIDIVVGAKGSPLQLILSSVYHMDIPTGNIAYDDARKWINNPQVKTAIPLALGDSWKGFRIVGTTPSYIAHYNAELSDGRIWSAPFEAVAGASVNITTGQEFKGAHGLIDGASGHDGHDHGSYKIVGTLKRTGTVLDRLILTSLDSVLMVHGMEAIEEAHGHHHGHDHHHDHKHDHDHAHGAKPEITALLLSVKTPIAKINLPRAINRESALQAANPSYEIMRLTAMSGLGRQSFIIFSAILIAAAAMSIFSGIAGNLDNRLNDLAVLRAIGYSRTRISKIIVMESLILVTAGIVTGIAAGSTAFLIAGKTVPSLAATGVELHFTSGLVALILFALIAGLAAATVPVLKAARIDAARLLSNRL